MVDQPQSVSYLPVLPNPRIMYYFIYYRYRTRSTEHISEQTKIKANVQRQLACAYAIKQTLQIFVRK